MLLPRFDDSRTAILAVVCTLAMCADAAILFAFRKNRAVVSPHDRAGLRRDTRCCAAFLVGLFALQAGCAHILVNSPCVAASYEWFYAIHMLVVATAYAALAAGTRLRQQVLHAGCAVLGVAGVIPLPHFHGSCDDGALHTLVVILVVCSLFYTASLAWYGCMYCCTDIV